MNKTALVGTNILVARPEQHAQELVTNLRDLGATVLPLALFAIEPTKICLQANLSDKFSYGCIVICMSRNAAELILPHIKNTSAVRWATVGPATAEYLQTQGVDNVICPAVLPYDSMGLLQALLNCNIDFNKQEFKIICGENGSSWLQEQLLALGANLEVIPVYKRTMPNISASELLQTIFAVPPADIMVITCVTSLVNLQNLSGDRWNAILAIPLLVVSDRIQKVAFDMGFKQIFVAKSMAESDITNALIAWNATKIC